MNQPMDEPAKTDQDSEQEIDFLNGSSLGSKSEPGPPITPRTLDFMEKIEREIEEEVRKKRAQGAFPPAFERRLKRIFEQLVPPGAGNSRRDFEALLRSSDRAAYFDIDVPIASQKPGVARLKKLLRLTQAWYLNYLAQQLNNFSTNLMRLLYVFDARVKKLEDSMDSATRVRPSGEFLKPYYPSIFAMEDHIANTIKDVGGRVLLADCGNGYLVLKLKEQGIDCYGVDSFGDEAEKPYQSGLDLRWQDLNEHLLEIADGALSAVVIQGSIDLITAQEKLNLLSGATRALEPHGTLAVISVDPDFFDRSPDLAVQRDLAPGRPFAPETLRHVLDHLGFSRVSTEAIGSAHLTLGHLGNIDVDESPKRR